MEFILLGYCGLFNRSAAGWFLYQLDGFWYFLFGKELLKSNLGSEVHCHPEERSDVRIL